MRAVTVCCCLALCLSVSLALPNQLERIAGGAVATITDFPFAVSLLYSRDLTTYLQDCGGSILSTSAIVSAAHCFVGDAVTRWRARVGAASSTSGGTIHNIRIINTHPGFNVQTYDNDVAVLRTSTNIAYTTSVLPGSFAFNGYTLLDDEEVTAIGWGQTTFQGAPSSSLRRVQIWSVNQETCRNRYTAIGSVITDNMLCAGWLDFGIRGQCKGDDGSPLVHNNIIVGIFSWGNGCASARYPAINTRVSTVFNWIQTIANT